MLVCAVLHTPLDAVLSRRTVGGSTRTRSTGTHSPWCWQLAQNLTTMELRPIGCSVPGGPVRDYEAGASGLRVPRVCGERTAASPWRHSMPVRTFPQHSAISAFGYASAWKF